MRIVPLLAVLVAGTLALPPGVAHAQGIAEDKDRVGENIGPEADALIALAAAIEADVASGALVLSEEAQGHWGEGKAVWDEIERLADAKDYGGAYRTARKGRAVMRRALREAFKSRPSKPVWEALVAYIEAVEPRLGALANQFENYEERGQSQESYFVAVELWKDAEKAAKRKQHDAAFRMLQDCLAELDKVIYDVYPRAR